jgi:hypothetical protein
LLECDKAPITWWSEIKAKNLPTIHFDSWVARLRVADPGVLGDFDAVDFVALDIDPADLPELKIKGNNIWWNCFLSTPTRQIFYFLIAKWHHKNTALYVKKKKYLWTPILDEPLVELKATLLLAMLKLGCACSETRLALRDVAFGAVFEFWSHLSPNPPSFLSRKFAGLGLTKNLKENEKYTNR